MKKLLSRVMSVIFVFTMLFALPTQKISAAINYEDALNATVQKYIGELGEGYFNDKTNFIPGYAWIIIGLARSEKEVPKEIFDNYYKNVEAYVHDKTSKNEKMSGGDLAKLVLSVSAIGEDPRNVAGNDLIDIIWHQDGILREYYTSLAYVLIAVDSKNYEEPSDALNTRDDMIKALLSNELKDGGFGWGSPEADSTAMVLQALVKHQDREDVTKTMKRSITALSNIQTESGGYIAFGKENSNSPSQVITLLTALGENPTTDKDFIKGENNLLTNLMSFYIGNGEFKYIHSDKGGNGMATEQALYSLVAYDRLLNKKTALYDMVDVISTTDYLNNVKEVNLKIQELPEVTEVSLDNKEEVNSILAKFNSLPEEYKLQVVNASKLEAVSSKIAEIQSNIDKINDDIWNKINPENISLENKNDVLDIISRYEALSENDKKHVNGYEEVLAAKAKIEALEKAEADNNVDKQEDSKTEENETSSSSSEVVPTGDTSNFGYLFVLLALSVSVMIYSKKNQIKEA